MNETVVKGSFSHFNERGEFVYAYTCSDCGRRFPEPCPEVSYPPLCHACYSSKYRGNQDQRKGVEA